jgi:hypothetical protein
MSDPLLTMVANNLDSIVDPNVNDDSIKGYSLGSIFINKQSREAFICLDNKEREAVWQNFTLQSDSYEQLKYNSENINKRFYLDVIGSGLILADNPETFSSELNLDDTLESLAGKNTSGTGNIVLSESPTLSGATLNGNISGSSIDIDQLLTADLDTLVPSQKAIKGYVDNSLAGNLTPSGLAVNSDQEDNLSSTYSGSQTNTNKSTAFFRHSTSGDMADGFGTLIDFSIKDDTAEKIIGKIGFERSGADDVGNLVVLINTSGTFNERFRINNNGRISVNGTHEDRNQADIGDDGNYSLYVGKGFGFVQVGDNEEWALFSWSSDCTINLIQNSTNVVTTDTDEKFCILDAGDHVDFKNRLGSTKSVRWFLIFS